MVFFEEVFESEINKAIVDTYKHFERANYKAGLQSGLWDLQVARDSYRNNKGGKQNLNKHLIRRFLEVQLLLVTPLIPHFSEYLWQEVLKKPGFIVNAPWPEAGKVDLQVIKRHVYLKDQLHEFRLRLQTLQKAKKGKLPPICYGRICVLEDYPTWQRIVLEALQKLYIPEENKFMEYNDKDLIEELKKHEEVATRLQNAMSFLAHIKNEVKRRGEEALSLRSSFNEKEFFEQCAALVCRSLEIPQIKVHCLTEVQANELAKPPVPSSPIIQYYTNNDQLIK